MQSEFDFIDRLKLRIAMSAIGRSTLRNQGAAGMVDHARKYLYGINLQNFCVEEERLFVEVLDEHSCSLAKGFPGRGKGNWGAARKSLNIFLRDCVYNRHLAAHFDLAKIEPWLEVPLDSNVYAGLKDDNISGERLGRWRGVSGLTRELSNELQACASAIADKYNVLRVHLDVLYYRRGEQERLRKQVAAA